MHVNSFGAMEQMQTQMRKMDGTGSGQGKGGMKDIMQSLSMEDKMAMKSQLSFMSEEDRMAAISEMKTIDKASMNSDDYVKSLLDILDQTTAEDVETDGFSAYA